MSGDPAQGETLAAQLRNSRHRAFSASLAFFCLTEAQPLGTSWCSEGRSGELRQRQEEVGGLSRGRTAGGSEGMGNGNARAGLGPTQLS